MPVMAKQKKEEWAYFINEKGRREYNEKCRNCVNECMQSYRAEVVYCPKYKNKRTTA